MIPLAIKTLPKTGSFTIFFFFFRFDGKCVIDENDLSEIINEGPKSKKFRDLIVWITDEIRVLAKIEEKVILKTQRTF